MGVDGACGREKTASTGRLPVGCGRPQRGHPGRMLPVRMPSTSISGREKKKKKRVLRTSMSMGVRNWGLNQKNLPINVGGTKMHPE